MRSGRINFEIISLHACKKAPTESKVKLTTKQPPKLHKHSTTLSPKEEEKIETQIAIKTQNLTPNTNKQINIKQKRQK